jgi:uracil-DNA glycosylase family 4
MRDTYPQYHNAPVAPFGDVDARLLIVGLAPGMHGANASGRPFTGDFAGILLYRSLFKAGLSSGPESRARDDGLRLLGCRITNAVKCLPPQNKPSTAEADTCNAYLRTELHGLPENACILALGAIAHRAVLRAYDLRPSAYAFGHGHEHRLPNATLVDSYHCSRYNTQTKRLTAAMFEQALERAAALASAGR